MKKFNAVSAHIAWQAVRPPVSSQRTNRHTLELEVSGETVSRWVIVERNWGGNLMDRQLEFLVWSAWANAQRQFKV